MLAIAYARWSSMEQTKGSTLVRQIENTTAFIEAWGWQNVAEPMIDRGKSAYTGANIETGQLGKFRDSIMSGRREASNLVLVVEELDRLSRQPADIMLSWLSPLVRKGLTIAVVNTGQMITREMLDHDMGGLMMILITAFGSHTESRKKAKRVAAAWEQKREAARNGEAKIQRNHRRPKWVEIDDAGQFYVPEHKEKIVKLIFENRVNGIGKGLTAKRLNEMALTDSRYAPWELDAGERKAPSMWTATYIGRVLRNRAVMGEWQPYRRPRNGEVTALEPIADYYPRIIDPALFMRANEKRIADALKHQGRGRGLSNLLGTKAICAECGGQMSALGSAAYFTNKKGEKHRHYFLYCRNAKVGKTCENQRGWTYDRVEGPILDRILTLAMDDQHFASDDQDTVALELAVHSTKASIAEIERKIENVLDVIEGGGGAQAKGRLLKLQQELEHAQEAHEKAVESLSSARGAVSPSEHIKRVSEVRMLLWSDDEDERFQARSRVKAALQAVLQSIRFHPRTGNVTVRLVANTRMFAINHGGEIIDDIDLGGPHFEPVTVVDLMTGDTEVRNNLDLDQRQAAKDYQRRKETTDIR
ncbi:recombinase family protein [Sphingomonas sp. IC081]|uniref:recombinase family protein n=1 Tax=Sphingomonas sp. IC081 TaxID=304378 RepID=UPI00115C0836|nr:recombinase family protein [Sphingomonas sp. IC081]QDK34714.1 hypothetical protein DM450_18410 [Sphingomonas sp. IC081]